MVPNPQKWHQSSTLNFRRAQNTTKNRFLAIFGDLMLRLLPVGSRKSGRSGVRCIMLGSGLGGGRAAAVLTLLASAGGRRREAAGTGPGPGWIGRWTALGLDLPLLSELRNRRSRERKYHQILSKSGSEQNRRSRKPLPKFQICKSKIL